MFNLSNVRQISDILTSVLNLESEASMLGAVRFIPAYQTARIGEFNQFIVKSEKDLDEVERMFNQWSIDQGNLKDEKIITFALIERLLSELKMESIVCLEQAIFGTMSHGLLNKGKPDRPLLIFNSDNPIPCTDIAKPQWYGIDLPALWIGKGWEEMMSGVEAYFAIKAEIKLEVELNRYKHIYKFGDFAVGMVRF